MVVNEQTLAAMMDVPFDNFERVIKQGDPENPKIQIQNQGAAQEYEKFLDELNQELKEPEAAEEAPVASPETLRHIYDTVTRALEKRKAQAASELGIASKAAYWEERQRQAEKARQGKRQWKRL
ncbi:MAG: hypothetical protein A2Y82_05015 [Candidatus Buchananbacteria bacterium RBG_13_36_9]|uniref:Uncharacterized protein n=1 Tax=Candidatus Buchananbacteria bacterium RBG_13_36_9 TaxID=1797530 RepID=A0A1G1XQA0_9BACT|nr:MAG: hypothetical protein A2Y82_05015 [Candidatus Buchananbacteria bacterium RBG_13_36_9]